MTTKDIVRLRVVSMKEDVAPVAVSFGGHALPQLKGQVRMKAFFNYLVHINAAKDKAGDSERIVPSGPCRQCELLRVLENQSGLKVLYNCNRCVFVLSRQKHSHDAVMPIVPASDATIIAHNSLPISKISSTFSHPFPFIPFSHLSPETFASTRKHSNP